MEIVGALLVLGLLAVLVVVVQLAQVSARQVRVREWRRQHSRQAAREVDAIARQTEDAIVSELLRRRQQPGHVVDGEVVDVRDEFGGRQ